MLNSFISAIKEMDWPLMFIVIFAGFIFITVIFVDGNRPYDTTDEGSTRSGLTLYTDNLTGCQYLEAGIIGGITPRLNGSGEHVGCHPANPQPPINP